MNVNIFATMLTDKAPAANNRGEKLGTRLPLQKITVGGALHAVVSSEAVRNALREMLLRAGQPMNRTRLYQYNQPAVTHQAFPDATSYADDCLWGYLVLEPKARAKHPGRDWRRTSLLRVNLALALEPCPTVEAEALLHQSPLSAPTGEGEAVFQNDSSAVLYHGEVCHTAFQYPWALEVTDPTEMQLTWIVALLRAFGELTQVGGNHARNYFEFAPRSFVLRMTPRRVRDFRSYCFERDGSVPELSRVCGEDLPGREFWLAGDLVRDMPLKERERLAGEGAHLFVSPQKALEALATRLVALAADRPTVQGAL